MPQSKTPHLRFKGFSGDALSKKLEEVVVSNTYGPRFNANDYDVNGNVKTIRGTDISLDGNILYNQVPIASLDTNFIKSHILEDGDLVIITTADCGLTGIFEEQKDKYICSAYAVKITLNKTLTFPKYFKYFFQTTLAKNEVNKFIRKATVANLPASDILRITHKIPSKKEQEKIALFLTSLYKLIEQKEKKYQKLKQFKTAMLSQMFPKEGEHTSKLRFKGFSGEWEEKILGKLSTIKTGYPFDSNSFDEKGEYLVITNGNIQNNSPFVDNSLGNRLNIQNIVMKEYILNIDDILVTMDGTVGRIAKVVEKKQILAQRVGRLTATIEAEFLYHLLNTGDFFKKMTLISHGGTIKHISLTEISNYETYIPKNITEQTKIGNYFQKLDTLIDLHQKELEKLKNMKKALLAKMFV